MFNSDAGDTVYINIYLRYALFAQDRSELINSIDTPINTSIAEFLRHSNSEFFMQSLFDQNILSVFQITPCSSNHKRFLNLSCKFTHKLYVYNCIKSYYMYINI